MSLGTRRNLNARTQQGVISDRYPTQLAVWSDVDVFTKASVGFGQQRPVSDKNRWVALPQHLGKKHRSQQNTQASGNAREKLTRFLDRRVSSRNRPENPIPE